MLANAMCQMLLFRLTRRVRQQAGSYRPYAPHQPAYFDAPGLALGIWRLVYGAWLLGAVTRRSLRRKKRCRRALVLVVWRITRRIRLGGLNRLVCPPPVSTRN